MIALRAGMLDAMGVLCVVGLLDISGYLLFEGPTLNFSSLKLVQLPN
jgi:hypothetical protein